MSVTLGVSLASDPSRVVLHLLDHSSSSENKISSTLTNEDPFPSFQSDEEGHDGEEGGDLDGSHLVVQGPVHMQGTPDQAINYINSRINPKEQEPRMYFRSLPAGPEHNEDNGEGESNVPESLVELVISTKMRDDVQVQVEDLGQMDLFLQVIPHIEIQTFYLRDDNPNGSSSTLPVAIGTSLDKALSNHPTLRRLWLQQQAAVSSTSDTRTTDIVEDAHHEKGGHYSIAASILKHPQSFIQEVMVEGYGSTGSTHHQQIGKNKAAVLSKHMMSLLCALESNSSVHSISFVKTNLRLHENHDEEQATSMILQLGQTLCANRSIEKLYLGNLLEYLSQEGIESFAKSIRQMKGLKVLDLRLVHRLVLPRPDLRFGNHIHMQISPRRHRRRRHHFGEHQHHQQPSTHHGDDTLFSKDKDHLQPCLLKPIVDALEDNCSLIKIPGWKKYLDCCSESSTQQQDPNMATTRQEFQKESRNHPTSLENALNYQLQLNRSRAKQFVYEPAVSIAAWSLVLEKCKGNPTAMYYCLRYKVVSGVVCSS